MVEARRNTHKRLSILPAAPVLGQTPPTCPQTTRKLLPYFSHAGRQTRPTFGQCWPNLDQIGLTLARFGSELAKLDQHLPNTGGRGRKGALGVWENLSGLHATCQRSKRSNILAMGWPQHPLSFVSASCPSAGPALQDVLCLTQPELVARVHRESLLARLPASPFATRAALPSPPPFLGSLSARV